MDVIVKNIREQILVSTFMIFLAIVTLKVFDKVFEAQPTPYIDEIFHIPQAQLYCRNIWTEWNPKITTLPGLYLTSYVLLKPLEVIKENVCSEYSLRFTNVVGTMINFLLSFKILCKLQNTNASKNKYDLKKLCLNVVSAVNIATFPPLYFFTFLYYTDVWSVTSVLFMYYEHLSSTSASKYLAGVSGIIAVLIRQTNIIWVGLMIIENAWRALTKDNKSKRVQDYKYSIEILKTCKKYLNFKKKKKGKENYSVFFLFSDILHNTYPYLVVSIMFLIFIIFNGSIVVGDKAAHTAVFHPMQFLYFLDFAAFFGLPFFCLQMISRKTHFPNMYIIIFLFGVVSCLSEVNKLEHPYLLADNRHLAFYIWKRIFGHNIMRRVITPGYVTALILLYNLLGKCHFMFKVGLAISIFLNLSLQYLFELRYFITPYVMCRLHFQQNASVWLELIYFSLLNTFVIYLFLNKPFTWASEPNVIQRFIW